MRNVALLEQTMTQIRDYPELHEQGSVFSHTECGTAACFAGWACMLAGYEPVNELCADGPKGSVWAMFEAEDLLGINHAEADVLFDSRNSRGMLELMVKDLVNGGELRPWSCYQDLVK